MSAQKKAVKKTQSRQTTDPSKTNLSQGSTANPKSERADFLRKLALASIPVIITGFFSVWQAFIKNTGVSDTPSPTVTQAVTPAMPPEPSIAPTPDSPPAPIRGQYETDDPLEVLDPLSFTLLPAGGIDNEAFLDALDIFRARLDSMGNPYHLDTENHSITITTVRNSFGSNEYDVGRIITVFSSQGGISIGNSRLGQQALEMKDIQQITILPQQSVNAPELYRLELVLSSTGVRKLQQIITDIAKSGKGTVSIGHVDFAISEVHNTSQENSQATVTFGCVSEPIAKLISQVISTKPLPVSFQREYMDYHYKFPHEAQECMIGDRAIFSLIQQPDQQNSAVLLSGTEFEDAVLAIRQRMDALEKPFQISVKNGIITVTTVPDHLSYEVLRLLAEKKSLELYPALGDAIIQLDDVQHVSAFNSINVYPTDDGISNILLSTLNFKSDDDLVDFYLCINGVRVSRLTISIGTLRDKMKPRLSERLEFTSLLIHPESEITDNNAFLLSLISAIFHDDYFMPCSFLIDDFHFESDSGDSDSIDFGISRFLVPERIEITRAIQRIIPDAKVTQSISSDILFVGLQIDLDDQFPENFLATIRSILQHVDMKEYMYPSIIFYAFQDEDGPEVVRILVNKTFDPDMLVYLLATFSENAKEFEDRYCDRIHELQNQYLTDGTNCRYVL